MGKFLDAYFGPGATDTIWAHPHSEDPAKLRNSDTAKGLDRCSTCGDPIWPTVQHFCKGPAQRTA
jgi:hypothetical protein